MMKPTIHLNGTSAESLMEQYTNALYAVYAARAALSETSPNGRDYYPQGTRAIMEAATEHEARMRKLGDVYRELEELIQHISDATQK